MCECVAMTLRWLMSGCELVLACVVMTACMHAGRCWPLWLATSVFVWCGWCAGDGARCVRCACCQGVKLVLGLLGLRA